jgi:hypothetical protein
MRARSHEEALATVVAQALEVYQTTRTLISIRTPSGLALKFMVHALTLPGCRLNKRER